MRENESGNVFFYIFLAVALFGALTYAVSESGRGTLSSITKEQSRLRATEIIDYSDAISKAVGTLRLRGTTLADLRFSHDELLTADYGDPLIGDPTNHIFNAAGGGIVYKTPASDILVTPGQQWMFLNQNQVEGFGTTCTTESCSDLLMALGDVKTDVCLEINILGDIKNPTSSTLPSDSNFEISGKFKGQITGTPQIIGNETSSAVLASKSYGCFTNNADDKNYFYRVLWSQ